MMSLLALTGLVAYEVGSAFSESEDNTADAPDDFALDTTNFDDGSYADGLMAAAGAQGLAAAHPQETAAGADEINLDRGALIDGFDPASDVLEFEYTAALGLPEVSVIDFADGTGASVALDGVVLADVTGAQGLDPGSVILTAV